jgi:hypothetical protein
LIEGFADQWKYVVAVMGGGLLWQKALAGRSDKCFTDIGEDFSLIRNYTNA